MIDKVLYGEQDPFRNYYNWLKEGAAYESVVKFLFTGVWVTSLVTFHFVETFIFLVLGWSFREIYLGVKTNPEAVTEAL